MQFSRFLILISMLFVVFVFGKTVNADEYHIGPEKKYQTPNDFPWEAILPGDIVNIHWREKSYKSKWAINQAGTAKEPIIVRGVKGPKNQRPIIDARNAITRPQLNYWGGERSIIKIGATRFPQIEMASFILIEGLELRGAKPGAFYIGSKGVTQYLNNAAGLFIEKGNYITVRDCLIHDCGNGLFVSHESSNILIEGCEFRDNGVENRFYEHNVYTAAQGITFQFNRFGPLRKGCGGNNLKDRSSGVVIRYNWIEGGNRQLDLVDAEDSERLRNAPGYQNTLVYGNVFIERAMDGNNQIVHFGGDSGNEHWYRNGTLYFYNNTVVSYRPGKTVLFRLSTNQQKVDCRNNIYWTPAEGSWLAILDEYGQVNMAQNWLKKGWIESHSGEYQGTITVEKLKTGIDPGFVDASRTLKNFKLKKTSPCKNAGVALPKELLPTHKVAYQFQLPLGKSKRTDRSPADLGALN